MLLAKSSTFSFEVEKSCLKDYMPRSKFKYTTNSESDLIDNIFFHRPSPLQMAKPADSADYAPVTPTSSLSSLPTNNIALTPSSSGFNNRGRTTAAIAIVKQEGHRLMQQTKPNNLTPKLSTPHQQQQQVGTSSRISGRFSGHFLGRFLH